MRNTMIIGAGEACNVVMKELELSTQLDSKLCCIIDDNPRKHGTYIHGVKVVGGRDSILDNARKYGIKRGDVFMARFTNGHPSMLIKASGNGPYENGVQYAKQFEGIGRGACKAFTPWYRSCNVSVGDLIKVEFLSENEVLFVKI